MGGELYGTPTANDDIEAAHSLIKLSKHYFLKHQPNVRRFQRQPFRGNMRKEKSAQCKLTVVPKPRRHQCNMCGKAFAYKANLLKHIDINHGKVPTAVKPKTSCRLYICKMCGTENRFLDIPCHGWGCVLQKCSSRHCDEAQINWFVSTSGVSQNTKRLLWRKTTTDHTSCFYVTDGDYSKPSPDGGSCAK